jgi:hypothetical protein
MRVVLLCFWVEVYKMWKLCLVLKIVLPSAFFTTDDTIDFDNIL